MLANKLKVRKNSNAITGHMEEIGSYGSISSLGTDAVINGSYIYFFTSRYLYIYNISNPSNVILDYYGPHGVDSACTMCVFKDSTTALVYNPSYDDIEVFDFTNPILPVHQYTFDPGGQLLANSRAMKISGNYLFIASDGDKSITSLDVSDLSTISIAHNLILSGVASVKSTIINGNYLYTHDSINDSIVSIDISNPANMVQKDTLAVPNISAISGSIVFGNGYLFVVSQLDSKLYSIDISNPLNMSIADTLNTSAYGNLQSNLMVAGNYLYTTAKNTVPTNNPETFLAVDISTPTSMSIAYTYTDSRLFQVQYSMYSNNYVYCCSNLYGITSVLNVSNPSSISRESTIITADDTGDGWYIMTRFDDTKALIYDDYVRYMTVYDISDTTDIKPLYVYSDGNFKRYGGSCVHNNVVYTVNNEIDVFEAIDFTNPQNPVIYQSASSAIIDVTSDAVYDNGIVYITSSADDRIVSFDVSNLNSITLLDDYRDSTLLNGASSLALSGDYIFAVGYNPGGRLVSINKSNPSNLTLGSSLAVHPGDGSHGSIKIVDDVAYISSNGYITSVDISDPLSMSILHQLALSGSGSSGNSLDITGSIAVVVLESETSGTVHTIDITNPSSMSVIDTLTNTTNPNLFQARSVLIQGTTALVGTTATGVWEGAQVVAIDLIGE
jgi:hypothetical protein